MKPLAILLGVLFFVNPARGPETGPEPVATVSSDGHLMITSPMPNATIASPVAVTGIVTGGGWFFEGTFPIKILAADGTVLGQGMAKAYGDWMFTGSVPFAASITFVGAKSSTGTILFAKDNPSGLAANAESFSLPVTLVSAVSAPTGTTTPSAVSPNGGTVSGTVLIGPTCPVETMPPSPQCAPQPFNGPIIISKNIQNPTPFKTIKSNTSGTFSILLPVGEYIFHPQGASALPRCDQKIVDVSADIVDDITINCDSGIR